MAYYLQMDGVDDKLSTPSMTATEFILELKPRPAAWEQYINFVGKQVNRNGSNADQFHADYSAVYVDGVAKTTNTAFILVNTRQILRGVLTTAVTADTKIYWNGASSYMEGELWDLKIYNGATLQAHYDFTLGNVQDQSGNGRHGTLTGGTFVEDGVSDHPVTASASAASSASVTIVKNRFATASAQATSTASATVVRKHIVTAAASAISTAAATVVKKIFISGSAQSTSSASATVTQSGGGVHNVSASAASTSSASVVVVKKRFASAAAAAVSSASVTMVKGIRITAAAVSTSTATVILGALYGQAITFNVHIKRALSFSVQIKRRIEFDVGITRIRRFNVKI